MPEVPVGLLQAIADPFNQPKVESDGTVGLLPELDEDPTLAVILASPDIDPMAKAILRAGAQRKNRTAKIEAQLEQIRQKELGEQSPGLISWLGPIPIGFQVGTALGVENPILRFAIDVVVDPINLIGVGGLTKLGRAAKVLQGISVADKAETIAQGARVLAEVLHKPQIADELAGLARAAASGSREASQGLLKRFKEIGKSGIGEDALRVVDEFDPQFGQFVRGSREDLRGLRAAFELGDKAKGQVLADSFLGRVAAGQSGFVNFRVPFTDLELGSVKLPKLLSSIGVTKLSKAVDLPDAAKAVQTLADAASTVVKAGPLKGLPSGFLKALQASGDLGRAADEFLPAAEKALESSKMTLKTIRDAEAGAIKEAAEVLGVKPEKSATVLKAFAAKNLKGVDLRKPTIIQKTLSDAFKVVEKAPTNRLAEAFASVAGTTNKDIAKILKEAPEKAEVARRYLATQVARQSLGGLLEVSEQGIKTVRQQIALQKRLQRALTDTFERFRGPKFSAPHRERFQRLSEMFARAIGSPPTATRRLFLAAQSTADLQTRMAQLLKNRAGLLLKGRGIDIGKALESLKKAAISADISGGAAASKALVNTIKEGFKSASAENVLQFSSERRFITSIFDGTAIKSIYGTDEWAKTGENIGSVTQGLASALNGSAFLIGRQIKKTLNFDSKVDELITLARESPERLKEFQATASDAVKALYDEIDTLFRDVGRIGVEKKTFRALRDNYVTHVVKFVNETQKNLFWQQWISKRRTGGRLPGSRFGLPRQWPTIEEMEEFIRKNPTASFRIQTKKISEILPIYLRSAGVTTIRNETIRTLVDLRSLDNLPFAIDTTQKLSREVLQRAADYQPISNEILKHISVHKLIAPHLKALYDRNLILDISEHARNDWEKVVQGMIRVNDFSKSAIFRMSPFHFVSLSLSAFGLLPFRTAIDIHRELLGALRKNPKEAIESALRIFSHGRGNADDLFNRFRIANAKLGRIEINEYDLFGRTLNLLKDKTSAIPAPINPFTGLANLNELMDANLWEIWQNGMKYLSWIHIRQAELLRDASRFSDPAMMFKLDTDVAQIVNKAFGGQAWEKYLISPTTLNFLRFALIAPDWTIGNIRMATDVFVNLPGVRNLLPRMQKAPFLKHLTADIMLPDVHFRWALKYTLRSGVYSVLFANMLNYAFTGKFLWDADPDQIDPATKIPRVQLPYTNADGRRQYMDVFKQFAEPWEMVTNPTGFARRKMGALPRLFSVAVLGVDGFGRPISGTEDGPYKQVIDRIKESTGQFTPISAAQLFDVATGPRPLASAAISSFGFPVKSESKEAFNLRLQRELLERQLQNR